MTSCAFCYKVIPKMGKNVIMDAFGQFFCNEKCQKKYSNGDWRPFKKNK